MRCLESLVQKYCNHPQKLPQIHTLLITTGFFLSPPPDSQSRCQGSISTTFVYNCLIRAYLRCGDPPATALHLFTQMLALGTPPNHHTFPSLLKAAAASFSTGRSIHAQAIRRGLLLDDFVNCSIVRFYSQLGHLYEARDTFDEIPQPDLASCNAMLDAFCLNGDLESASHFFECMIVKDIISWTSLINGFARNGNFRGAMELFRRLMHKNRQAETMTVRPNEATFVSVLSACANMDVGAGALPGGTQIHGYIIRHETRMTAFLGTALIDMYGKHGRLSYCASVFNAMDEKEVCTWNAMISALASNGDEAVALGLLDRMRSEGLRPNHVTFVAILTACARARLVDVGLRWFEAMNSEFGVVPLMEHYGCVVDLLSRAGLLNEAVEFIRRMPMEADASVWGALLGACKVHGDVQLGIQVGRRMITLQPWHSGVYTVLRNMYAGEGRWNEAAELREAMENAGVKKIIGQSWIDSGCSVQIA